MTHRPLAPLALLGLTGLLTSCSTELACGNAHPYAGYTARAPLAAPAGVTVSKPDAAYLIPAAGTGAKAPAAANIGVAQPCLVTPPEVLTPADLNPARPKAAPAASTTAPATPAPAARTRPNLADKGPLE